MSSNNDPPAEEPLLESAQEQEPAEVVTAAQPSLAAHDVATQGSRTAITATASLAPDNEGNSSDALTAEVDFDKIFEVGKLYTNAPSSGRDWLRGFPPLHDGTDVSLRFISTPRVEHLLSGETLTQYPSLLPLLSVWLESWFEISKAARIDSKKRGTKPSSPALREEADVEWLETYISDYLSLPNAGFEDDHIVTLAEKIFNVCRKSNSVSQIGGAINVLYAILCSHGCPESILESFLETLCGARSKLPAPISERAATCIHMILKGFHAVNKDSADGSRGTARERPNPSVQRTTERKPRQNKAVLILLGFLQRTFSKDDGLRVNVARGAILTFSEPTLLEGPNAPEIDELLEVMRGASQKRIIRLDAELLAFCNSLLQNESVVEKILSRDQTTFIQLLENLSRPVQEYFASDAASSIRSSGELQLNEMKRNAERLRKVNIALEQIWDRLDEQPKRLVYLYFMQSPRFLSTEQAMRAIKYVQDTGTLWPENKGWERAMADVIKIFLGVRPQPRHERRAARVAERILGSKPARTARPVLRACRRWENERLDGRSSRGRCSGRRRR